MWNYFVPTYIVYYEIEMGAICTNFLGIFEIGDILYRRKLWVFLFVSKQFGEKRL